MAGLGFGMLVFGEVGVMEKIFVICPVRSVEEEFKNKIDSFIKYQESIGNTVHYPPRDTNQNDSNGLNICLQNLSAIKDADKIYIAWDGKSQGSLFDLGIAFALDKNIIPIEGCFPEKTPYKSFQNVVYKLSEQNK